MSLLSSHLIYTATTLLLYCKSYLKNGDYIRVIFHVFWLFCYLIIVACNQGNLVLYSRDAQKLSNGTLQLCQHFQGKHQTNLYRRSQKIRSILLTLMCCNAVSSIALCGVPTFLIFRGEPFHFGSHVYNFIKNLELESGNLEIFATFCATAMESWIIIVAWGACLIHMYVQLVVVQTFVTTLSFYIR